MNPYLKRLLELGAVLGGKYKNDNGFIVFERLSNPDLEKIEDSEIAFATLAMGRSVFVIDEKNKIVNYKGVDSHLSNEEMACMSLVPAEAKDVPNPNKTYEDSTYPISLIIFAEKRPEIRIRGASPLIDLELEAYVNAKMQGNGIKLPEIKGIKEFDEFFSNTYHLPIKIDSDFDEQAQSYIDKKQFLKNTYGDAYKADEVKGKRPETLGEYLKRVYMQTNPSIQGFLQEKGFSIQSFIEYIDSSYSLGQRYGQTERIVENPFRIADLELYTKQGNVDVLENIVAFSESIHNTQEPMENYFAKQMGTNLANMLNSGWMCENFSHRQDYSLAGEMCDDSYQYLPEELEKVEELELEPELKQFFQKQAKKRFLYQIYILGSNIKVLQDEMRLRGKSSLEINSVMTDFISTFSKNLDLDKVTSLINVDAPKALEALVKTPKNYEKILAEKYTDKGLKYDEEVLFAQQGNNAFFDEISARIASEFGIERDFMLQNLGSVKTEVKPENSSVPEERED